LFVFATLSGVFTLAWRGTIPGPSAFFFQDALLVTLLASILILWLFMLVREGAKYGQARALGIESRFGIKSIHHWFAPKVFFPRVAEEQEQTIIGTGLLALLGTTMFAAIIATWTHSPWWTLVFAIGFIELLAECFLFLDTDLARYLSHRSRIADINRQTRELLAQDWKNLQSSDSRPAHIRISSYAFLFLVSVVLAILVTGAYFIPLGVGFITTSFERLAPGHPLFFDAAATLLFLTGELFLYGFATLRRHPLAHNTFFVNISVGAIIVASFIAASLTVQLLAGSEDTTILSLLLYAVGAVLALLFERAVALAHPFADWHTAYEALVTPVIAACVPLSILFTIPGLPRYFEAAILAVGMLSGVAFIEMRRTTPLEQSSSTALSSRS
jgi:hypothetical protein